MSKMSNIDLTIKNWFKNIIVGFVVTVIALLIYADSYKQTLEKEDRISNIETNLKEQMNYIHELKADVDNLYRVVE